MSGEPKQILKPKGKYSFELDEEVLEEILLLRDDVKNLPAVVISVAGTFRQGKSFLLSFFLRYLRAKGNANWLRSEDAPLEGFGWAAGRTRVTTGIYMWSEPFVVELEDKTKVAVLLMDTQGTFDGKSTIKGCGTVFALSTLLSSVLIYNMMKNIHEFDLDHLQIFTEYGSLALGDCESKPFQKLQFLVRDYPCSEECGAKGGEELLEERLQIEEDQAPELQSVRRMIKSCFTDIKCFTLPYPGRKVEMKNGFEGKISDMEPDFREHLSQFVPLILAPKNLIIKNISGNNVTVGDLYGYFRMYFHAFLSDKIPAPQTMLMGIITSDNMMAIKSAVEHYDRAMGKLLQILSNDPNSTVVALEEEHILRKNEALDLFKSKKKRGGAEGAVEFQKRLDQDLEKRLCLYRELLRCQQKLRVLANQVKITYKQEMKTFFEADNKSNIQEVLEKAHSDFLGSVMLQFSIEYLELDPAGAMSEECKGLVGVMIEDSKFNLIMELNQIFTKLRDQMKNKVELKDAIAEIEQIYAASMEHNCGPLLFFQNTDIINSHHSKAKTEAMESFFCKSAIYNDITLQNECKTVLDNKITSIYKKYIELNEKKQVKERIINEICSKIKMTIQNETSTDFDFMKYLKIASDEWNKYKTSNETQMHEKYEEKLIKDIEKICKFHQDNIICSCARIVAKERYKTELSNLCGASMEKAKLEEVFVAHMNAKREVLDEYETKTMSVDKSTAEEHKRKLEEDLCNIFECYKEMNEGVLLMSMPEWNVPQVLKWKEEAMKFQQKCYDFYTECRKESHDSSDDSFLKKQIGIAISGLPGSNQNIPSNFGQSVGRQIKKQLGFAIGQSDGSQIPDTDRKNKDSQKPDTDKKNKEINDVYKKIMKKNTLSGFQILETNFIFVSILINKEKSENRGLIHVKKPESTQGTFYEYFDCNGNAYLNWNDYLENNDLPECHMCYPKKGIYTAIEGKIVADFSLSHACRISEKMPTYSHSFWDVFFHPIKEISKVIASGVKTGLTEVGRFVYKTGEAFVEVSKAVGKTVEDAAVAVGKFVFNIFK